MRIAGLTPEQRELFVLMERAGLKKQRSLCLNFSNDIAVQAIVSMQ